MRETGEDRACKYAHTSGKRPYMWTSLRSGKATWAQF